MKIFKFLAITLLSIFLTVKSYSQGDLFLHAGPSLPLSDFASDDVNDENFGGAAVGINFGLQYVYPLSETGLGIFGGIDINYNGLKKNFKDDIGGFYETIGINTNDIKYYKYINVPVTAGWNYTYTSDNKIGVFINGGLTLNFLKITEMEINVGGLPVTTEMDLASNLGFKIGGGFLINQNITASIDYYGLGKHDLEGKYQAAGVSLDIEKERKVDLLTLTVGYKF